MLITRDTSYGVRANDQRLPARVRGARPRAHADGEDSAGQDRDPHPPATQLPRRCQGHLFNYAYALDGLGLLVISELVEVQEIGLVLALL